MHEKFNIIAMDYNKNFLTLNKKDSLKGLQWRRRRVLKKVFIIFFEGGKT